jgi:hypothetical protein
MLPLLSLAQDPHRVKTPSRITLVLFSFCPSLRAPRCGSVPGAEGHWSIRYREAEDRGISKRGIKEVEIHTLVLVTALAKVVY